MATTYVKTLVTDEATDADSPVTATLMQDIGQSINYLIDAVFGSGANSEKPGGSVTAGDFTVVHDPVDRDQNDQTSYTKTAELEVTRAGTYRIDFSGVRTSGSGNVYFRIYRNGAGVGTVRTGISLTNYSEDIAGWSEGDLCQIYCYATTAGAAVSKFRLSIAADESLIPTFNQSLYKTA